MGKETVMVSPPPGVSSASRVPPIASVRPRDSASPEAMAGHLIPEETPGGGLTMVIQLTTARRPHLDAGIPDVVTA